MEAQPSGACDSWLELVGCDRPSPHRARLVAGDEPASVSAPGDALPWADRTAGHTPPTIASGRTVTYMAGKGVAWPTVTTAWPGFGQRPPCGCAPHGAACCWPGWSSGSLSGPSWC